jgi:hypothetical protein
LAAHALVLTGVGQALVNGVLTVGTVEAADTGAGVVTAGGGGAEGTILTRVGNAGVQFCFACGSRVTALAGTSEGIAVGGSDTGTGPAKLTGETVAGINRHLTEIAGEATVAGTGVIRTRCGGGLTDSIVLARMIIARVLKDFAGGSRVAAFTFTLEDGTGRLDRRTPALVPARVGGTGIDSRFAHGSHEARWTTAFILSAGGRTTDATILTWITSTRVQNRAAGRPGIASGAAAGKHVAVKRIAGTYAPKITGVRVARVNGRLAESALKAAQLAVTGGQITAPTDRLTHTVVEAGTWRARIIQLLAILSRVTATATTAVV